MTSSNDGATNGLVTDGRLVVFSVWPGLRPASFQSPESLVREICQEFVASG
jgi:hypothetical protein